MNSHVRQLEYNKHKKTWRFQIHSFKHNSDILQKSQTYVVWMSLKSPNHVKRQLETNSAFSILLLNWSGKSSHLVMARTISLYLLCMAIPS